MADDQKTTGAPPIREPWLFTSSEMRSMWLWGVLAGLLCSALPWMAVGAYFAKGVKP